MAGIPLDKAYLIAIFLETFLYGIFFTLFWITLWVLLKDRTNSNRFLIGALLFMLILSTVHIILDFVRVIEGFIVHRDSRLGGPIGYYAQISHPLNVAKNVFYALMSLTGDTVMAWRCYVVYGRSRLIVIFPILLILSSIMSIGFIISKVASAPVGRTIFVTATPWLTTFFVLTLCTNTYSTGFIVYRIWSTIRSAEPRHSRSRGLMPVIMALVESGALHATAWLALLITYLSGSNGQYAALDVITPLVVGYNLPGIVFSLIILQIEAYTSGVKSGGDITTTSWRSGRSRPATLPPNYPLHTLNETVTTHQSLHPRQTQSSWDDVSTDVKDRNIIEESHNFA